MALLAAAVCLSQPAAHVALAQSTVSADLSVTGTATAESRPGYPFKHAYSYHNAGPAAASGARLTVTLPAGARYSPYSSDTRCAEAAGTVTCDLGVLAPGASGSAAVWMWTQEPGEYTSTARLAAAESDPNPADNAASVTTRVLDYPTAELSVHLQQAVPDPIYAGDEFELYVGHQNSGPGHAPNTTIAITVTPDTSFIPTRGAETCAQSGAVVTCRIGTMWSRNAGIMVLSFRATEGGPHPFHATIHSDKPDPNAANNQSSATVTIVPSADVSVAIAESADPSLPGRPVTYAMRVTNTGPSPATSVTLVDSWSTTAPGGAALVSATTTHGTCAPVDRAARTVTCQLGTLASGASATVTVAVQPRGTGALTNTARAGGAERDPSDGNNSATESTTVGT